MRNRVIRTFTRGAKVRYVGNDPRMKDAWGESVQRVEHKMGDSVVGYFPAKYADGSIHCYSYSVKIEDLAIVY